MTKKKKKRDGPEDPKVFIVESTFERFKASATNWKRDRDASVLVVQKILDLQSQSTYITDKQLASAQSSSVCASRLQANVSAELLGRMGQLFALQQNMLQSLQTMGAVAIEHMDSFNSSGIQADSRADGGGKCTEDEDADTSGGAEAGDGAEEETNDTTAEEAPCAWPVDVARATAMLGQLRQQTLLEVSIYEMLMGELREGGGWGGRGPEGGGDAHDNSVTRLACFTYQPYLNESALNILLQLCD